MRLPMKLAALKADYLAACAPLRALYAELPPELSRGDRLARLAATREAGAVRETGAAYADALESWPTPIKRSLTKSTASANSATESGPLNERGASGATAYAP